MSFVEKEIALLRQRNEVFKQKEVRNRMSNDSIINELSDLRKKLENSLERISQIESFLGVSNLKARSKRLKKYTIDRTDSISNIILIEKDDDVPDDSQTIIVINEENRGEIIIVKTILLQELCRNILVGSVGETISFPSYQSTGRYAVQNDDGDWELDLPKINKDASDCSDID